MTTNELKKSSMLFETENGDKFYISKDDVTELSTKILVESMLNEKSEYFILQEKKIEKCNLLYKIVLEQEKTMNKKTKDEYLKAILDEFKDD